MNKLQKLVDLCKGEVVVTLTVHPCTPAIVARVQHGDVSWRATGSAQVD